VRIHIGLPGASIPDYDALITRAKRILFGAIRVSKDRGSKAMDVINKQITIWGFDHASDRSLRRILADFLCSRVWMTASTKAMVRLNTTDRWPPNLALPDNRAMEGIFGGAALYLRPSVLKVASLAAYSGLLGYEMPKEELQWLQVWDSLLCSIPTIEVETCLSDANYLLRCLVRHLELVIGNDEFERISRLVSRSLGGQPRRSHPVSLLQSIKQSPVFATVELGRAYVFSRDGAGTSLLKSGWWVPEAWGVWSKEGKASIQFTLAASTEVDSAVLELHCLRTINIADYVIQLNEVIIEPRMEVAPDGAILSILIDAFDVPLNATAVRIDIQALHAQSPFERGINADPRRLGLALKSLTLKRLEPCRRGWLPTVSLATNRAEVVLTTSARNNCLDIGDIGGGSPLRPCYCGLQSHRASKGLLWTRDGGQQ
jgi:hypothetical protein